MKAIVNVVCIFWLAIIAISTQVLASPSQDWIIAQQSLDGAFQNESATGTAAQATFEAINTFYLDPAIPPSNLQAAQEFLATTIAGHTEYLARFAIAMANANASNESTIADLLNRQNRDGGFGAYTGYESDPLSTQWVLRVFGTTQTNKQVAAKAISYLLSKQNSNGGWHIDGRSSVALTAEILLTLDAYQLTSGVTAAVSAGRAFLVQQKQNDYLWGQSFESALALSALSLGANSSAEFDLSVAALKARMNDSNSSWHSDVYTTALVLQAMKRVGALGLGGSTKGNAQGQVTLASSTQAIAGAAVTVMNSSFSAVTDTNGKFLLNNLPIGPQTLIIQKEGYTPTSVAVLIEKSKTIDAGKIALGQAQSSVFINGRVFENTSQINIPAATISLNGAKVISVKSGNDGTFEFINLPLGNYNFSISANGYHAVNGTFTLAAGKNLQINQPLVSISTPLVNDPASLHGLVLNASTRIPVADAKVWIDEQFVITDAQGNFNSPLVTRGTHQLRVEGAGYVAAQYTITFPAGASGELGTLLLNTASSSQAANNLQILSTSVDSITGKAIAGAMVSVVNAGITVVTDAQGQAVLNGISELSVNVEISAPGYWTQAYQLQASAFGSIAAQFKLLPKAPTATAHSISGFVRDQDTGLPISGAAVIIDSSHQAVTDADGHYSLLNLPIQNATIKVSALNYATLQQAIELGQTPAQYSLDLKLAKNVAATRVNLVSVDAPSSAMPAANENVQVVLENLTAETQNILMFVRVMNAQGEQKELLTPTVAGTQSVSPHVELLAGQRVTLNVPWNIGQLTAGAYTLSAEAVEVGSLNRELPKGIILSRGTAETDVTGVAQFSGALHITPPLSQAGATTPITLQALINNSGNQTLPSGDYKITLAEPTSGSIFHTATATLIEPLEQNAVAELDFGSWSPSATQIGALKVSIIRTDGIAGEITGDIYIGDVAKALFTIDQSVLPEGTSSIKGAVRLTGVDTRIGTSVDPLFVLVKTAVEKGAAFTGPAAVSWDKSNSCLGCHIQAQSLAALGASAGKAVIDQSVSHYLFNAISTAQRANGSLEISHPEYTRTSTLFGTWALTEWPDKQQSFRTLINGLNRLWPLRATSGTQTFWNQDHNSGWLNSPVAATALTALTASRTLEASKSIAVRPVDYRFSTTFNFAAGSSGDHAIKATEEFIFVARNAGRLEKIDATTGTAQVLFNSVAGVSGRINGLDISSDGTFWLSTEQGKVLNVNATGQIVTSYSPCSGATGGLVIDPTNTIYVACHIAHEIRRIKPNGAIELVATGGLLNKPYGLAWHQDGYLLAANYQQSRITKVAPSGTVTTYAEGLAGLPIHLIVHPSGDVYVSEAPKSSGEWGVDRIRPDGTAERVLWDSQSWAFAWHKGKFYASNRSTNQLKQVEEIPLVDTVLTSYQTAMPNMANYLLAAVAATSTDNTQQALVLIGLGEIRKQIPEGALLTQIDSKISQVAALLKTRQAPNGGWAANGIATDSTRDPLITALVGIALEYTSPSAQDPMVRNAITYLLSKQTANGSWKTTTGLFTTDLGTTSLVMVYMPKALDRIGGLDVKLALDIPNTIQLKNPSIVPSSQTNNASGVQYLWDLKGVTGNGRDIGFDLTIQNLALNETRPVATTGSLSFNNSFTNETINTPLSIPSVKAVSQLGLSLSTDKAIYVANEDVAITPVVNNLGPAFAGGQLKLSLRAVPDLASLTNLAPLPVDPLAAHQQQSLLSHWNTTTTLAGSYQVYGQLYDQQQRLVAEAIAPFTIQTTVADGANVQTLGAQVFTDKPVYTLADTVHIDLRALNFTANAIHQPTLGKLAIKNAAGSVVLERSYAIPQLVAAALFTRPELLNLAGKALGQYTATWQVLDATGETSLASAQAQFSVVNDLRLAVKGTVTVSQPRIDKGDPQTCTYKTTNNGSAALDNLAITASIVDLNSQLLMEAQNHTVPLAPDNTDTRVKSFVTNTYGLGDYACVLEAVIDGKTQVLANALFTVVEPPIKLTGDLQPGAKPRLLVLIDPSVSTAQQTKETYLRRTLTQAGWFYTIVNNADDFKTQLVNGGYSTYALLSEGVTLDAATLTALQANVGSGDGLVVAGSKDRRHQALEGTLGITARANQAYAKGVSLKQSALGTPWEKAFDASARVLNFNATTASVIGEYRNNLAGADPKTLLGALGTAAGFNGYYFEDFISSVSSVEGRLAAGGNFNIVYYGIGNKLPATPLTDVVVLGGSATFPNGKVYNGNLVAGGSVTGVSASVRSSFAAGAQLRGNTAVPIDFAGERGYLEEISRNIASFPANGKATLQYGGYTLKGDCANSVQVFTLNATELANATSLALNCIPANATVLLNVTGPLVKIQNIGLQALAPIRQKVLFNFPTATRVEVYWVGIEGSILAPLADFVNPQGNTNGQVIAKTWHAQGSGNMALFNYPFTGDLTPFMGASTRNAVALNTYQQGKTLFAGFDLLAQAAVLDASVGANGSNPFGELLLKALDAVQSAKGVVRPGKVIPVLVTTDNIGTRAVSGQALLTLSAGIKVIAPGSFAATTTPAETALVWASPLSLPVGEHTSQILYLQLPTTGTPSLQLQLKTGTPPDWVNRFEKSLLLPAQ